MLALKGLGYLWPYLAGYPMDKIAVIDNACAMRPGLAQQPGGMVQYQAPKLSMMQVSLCSYLNLVSCASVQKAVAKIANVLPYKASTP